MSLIDGLRARLDALLFRRGRAREVDEELAFHLDMEIAAAVGRGVPEAEARRAALARLGGVERVRAECREVRSGRFFEVLVQDLRYGARGHAGRPGFAVAAVLTLALGIGANTAVFSLVRGILRRPLPFAAGDRLVVLHQRAPGLGGDDELGFSAVELGDYRRPATPSTPSSSTTRCTSPCSAAASRCGCAPGWCRATSSMSSASSRCSGAR
jgi:hypothetical protein